VCVALAGGAFALGRATADTDGGEGEAGQARRLAPAEAKRREAGGAQGSAAAEAQGRAAGLREGRALGIREGRALQLPTGARRAFRAGYVAGANDVFGGFDGGWALGTPYVVTVAKGGGGVTYRIDSRRLLEGR